MAILRDHRGREIRLTPERLAHILDHPEMVGLENDIEGTLARPEMVIGSLSDNEVQLFYRQLAESRVGVKWLCVVVKHSANDAFILTAYLTDKPKKGVQLWPER